MMHINTCEVGINRAGAAKTCLPDARATHYANQHTYNRLGVASNMACCRLSHNCKCLFKIACNPGNCNVFCRYSYTPMKLIIARLLISALSIALLGWLLPGVHLNGSWEAVLAALVLAVVNALIRPILIVLTLPITVVTLGLFLFVINALMVMLVDNWLDGFSVDGFWWALLFSFLLALLNSILQNVLLKQYEKKGSRG
jgi:putative membrane protein